MHQEGLPLLIEVVRVEQSWRVGASLEHASFGLGEIQIDTVFLLLARRPARFWRVVCASRAAKHTPDPRAVIGWCHVVLYLLSLSSQRLLYGLLCLFRPEHRVILLRAARLMPRGAEVSVYTDSEHPDIALCGVSVQLEYLVIAHLDTVIRTVSFHTHSIAHGR